MQNGYILKSASGELTRERFLGIFDEIAFSSSIFQQRNVLCDFREAFFPDEAMSALLDIAMEMAKYRLVLKGRIAHVASPNPAQIQIARNLENLLAITDFNYRAFSDMEAARKWVSE
jgi:hypothetical protein